jgi:hypothetical protein
MPYKVRCKECKEFIYILEIMEQKTNYPCPSCNIDNVFDKKQSSKFFGVEEIKVEDFPDYENEVKKQSDLLLKQEQTQPPIGSKTETLSQKTPYVINTTGLSIKYEVLYSYKGLAYLLMFVSSGFFIYSLVQIRDTMGKHAVSAMLPTLITYVITMFSLFCLTKMIDFLFDLDKKTDNNV